MQVLWDGLNYTKAKVEFAWTLMRIPVGFTLALV